MLATLCVVVLFAACSNDPSSAATVGETGEISIDQLHADVALFGFLAKLSSVPCGTPVGNETQESACARFALANDIHEEVAKAYASENDVKVDPAAVTDALARLEDGARGRRRAQGAAVGRGGHPRAGRGVRRDGCSW